MKKKTRKKLFDSITALMVLVLALSLTMFDSECLIIPGVMFTVSAAWIFIALKLYGAIDF